MLDDHPAERGRSSRLLERMLLIVAAVSLGWYALINAHTAYFQAQQEEALKRLIVSRDAAGRHAADRGGRSIDRRTSEPRRTRPLPGEGASAGGGARIERTGHGAERSGDDGLVGRFEIERLGVSAIIRHGEDEATLSVAIGHLPGTAWPGDSGNVALAAHRDTFFRPLEHVRRGDTVRLTTPEGVYRYEVVDTMVVDPEDVWVLDPTDHPVLTLITCYPFSYVGAAPQRFIVRARQIVEKKEGELPAGEKRVESSAPSKPSVATPAAPERAREAKPAKKATPRKKAVENRARETRRAARARSSAPVATGTTADGQVAANLMPAADVEPQTVASESGEIVEPQEPRRRKGFFRRAGSVVAAPFKPLGKLFGGKKDEDGANSSKNRTVERSNREGPNG